MSTFVEWITPRLVVCFCIAAALSLLVNIRLRPSVYCTENGKVPGNASSTEIDRLMSLRNTTLLEYMSLTNSKCVNTKQLELDEFLDVMLRRPTLYQATNVTAGQSMDLEGWANINEVFTVYLTSYLQQSETKTILAIAYRRCAGFDHRFRIVEVGSYKGRSAASFAHICKQLAVNRRCFVIAVDTWTGSSEHFAWSLDRREMRDDQGQFRNMKQLNLNDTVFPLRLPSTGAAKTLRCFGIMADFVFIDADHEYISVLQDLAMFDQILKQGGYMMGDDYGWPTVGHAVRDFAAINNETLLPSFGANFVFRKSAVH